ncbi:Glyoxalase/Bleomycin resistance protein/Dihydroxybiphenyl dioxygenase [Xylogone sp. PMI_703]|nr:Glyoxalase/Bleomycin resistance protein/Dihydroxybiphenyl dioxygenase [Xylogone sp. PMI_703]
MSSEQRPPFPAPGPPFVSPEFSRSPGPSKTDGYLLNHVALQIKSPEKSLSFYVDFLGMCLVFAFNTGPFTAYYLGYPEKGDESPKNIAKYMGTRSGLLELIWLHEDVSNSDIGHGGLGKNSAGTGFAHLGIRVPDVRQTLKYAEDLGFKILKKMDDVEVRSMPLPSWASQGDKEGKLVRKWEGGFEKILAQIAFIEDPDGNCIEILPREIQ